MPRKSTPRPTLSKWQALVTERSELLGHSTRSLAEAISTPSRVIANSTIWAWCRCHDGAPQPSAYTPEINRLLAKALGITPETLADAYDKSRVCFAGTNTESDTRRLNFLRRMFADSARETWTKAEIVQTIDDLLLM